MIGVRAQPATDLDGEAEAAEEGGPLEAVRERVEPSQEPGDEAAQVDGGGIPQVEEPAFAPAPRQREPEPAPDAPAPATPGGLQRRIAARLSTGELPANVGSPKQSLRSRIAQTLGSPDDKRRKG